MGISNLQALPRSLRLLLLLLVYSGLIAGSLLPGAAPTPKYGFDIGLHTIVYAAVTISTVLLVGRPVLSALWLFGFASSLELAQQFVPGRSGSFEDVAANAIGIGAALVAVALWSHFMSRRRSSTRSNR